MDHTIIEKLELGKGEFEVIRVDCMRFERLSKNGKPDAEHWVGYMEKGSVDVPVFASTNKTFTLEQISRCCEEIEKFLETVEENKQETRN